MNNIKLEVWDVSDLDCQDNVMIRANHDIPNGSAITSSGPTLIEALQPSKIKKSTICRQKKAAKLAAFFIALTSKLDPETNIPKPKDPKTNIPKTPNQKKYQNSRSKIQAADPLLSINQAIARKL